jgi:homoserine kinase
MVALVPGTLLAPGTSSSVRVPATSANLGPGYDALGLGLAWYDDVRIEVTAAGLTFDVHGEGADTATCDESHLIIRAFRTALVELGGEARGLHLASTNRIPHGRGLGSSAAAICAGVLLARDLIAQATGRAPDGVADAGAVLALASRIEGHPDNVAACLLGGLTIAWTDTGLDCPSVAHAVALAPIAELRAVVFVPPFQSSTAQARRLLPAQVPHGDAAFTGARAALLVAGLTTRPDVLLAATEDRLHQPYRVPAMPASAELVGRLRTAGLPAVISGAGPTVLTFATSDSTAAAALEMAPSGWLATVVDVDRRGAHVGFDRPV